MQVRLTMEGTSQLVIHNSQLSDPLNDVSKEISKISSKRKKTPDDHEEMARLEFLGGLYLDEALKPVMPVANVKRTLVEAAKVNKAGKALTRALLVGNVIQVPIIYKGPDNPDALWADKTYRFRAAVRVGTGLVQRTRPRFPDWALVTDWELLTDVLGLEEFERICDLAGKIEGIGDHRTLGSGRFTAKVKRL